VGVTLSAWLIVAFLGAGVAYLGLAAYVWSNRQAVGARQLVVMLIAVKIWTLCYAAELSCRTVAGAEVWSALKYAGIVALPPALWSFVFAYTGRGPLPRRAFWPMMIHPVAVLTLLAVPAWRHLLQIYHAPPALLIGAPVPGSGKLFWVHSAYESALMLGAVATLTVRLARIAPPYRRQGWMLIAASLLPFVGNALFNVGKLGHIVDPTPFLFLVTGTVLVRSFFRLRGLDLTPVARGIVIEQMTDGVLVLDVYGRVADANAAGAAMIGQARTGLIGRSLVEILPGLAGVLQKAEAENGPAAVEDEVLLYPAANSPRDVAVSLTAVLDAMGRRIARLAVLRDVTERNVTERRVRELLDEQTRISETLSQSLRPLSLPDIPGLRLAARSVPSARGEVGGDFYDVHPVDEGVQAFVLGDVSGKGVHAAVVTSMARYTVRTLSAQGHRPAEVLRQLNRALLATDDVEQFCTVVYGQVGSGGRAGDLAGPLIAGGGRQAVVRLVITLGGHPRPLLRRRDRSVELVGEPGTALGLLPVIDVHEVTVDLAAGDVLLAYTDGVTEARAGDEEFGEERLSGVLASVEARCGELADAVADAVLNAVQTFASQRDDVALLVLAAT
jgi:PAS domain S-box-containing protein